MDAETNKEKLKVVIDKAMSCGWDHKTGDWLKKNSNLGEEYIYMQFIFDHDFLKCLFDDWEFHICEMAMRENRVNYLFDTVIKREPFGNSEQLSSPEKPDN